MSFRSLPPPGSSGPSGSSRQGGGLERWMARLMGAALWAMLALMGLVFALSLMVWLLVMTAVSLVSSLITGRPAAVTLLWRRYRELARQRWPARRADSATPRADATDVGNAPSRDAPVQDVAWRDVGEPPQSGR